MIRSDDIAHYFKDSSIVQTQEWDDMFNTDNTNEVARHQRRYNNYNELFGNNSDLKEELTEREEEIIANDKKMRSDNTNSVSDRINRYETTTYSGIVDITNTQAEPFKLFTEEGINGNTISHDFDENPLSRLYFSPNNIENIHSQIRYNVWMQSGKKHIIEKQSSTQVEIIMRSVFLQYSKNNITQLREQISQLNQHVIDYSVGKIISAIKQYIGYKKDISSLPKVMDYPVSMSMAGEKSLESKAWF
jgi:hypothetical protein